MVGPSNGSFVLSGAVSVDGAPLPACPFGAETVLYGRRACLFRAGSSPELHVVRAETRVMALAGRVYQPFAVHPDAGDVVPNLCRLAEEGPGAVEGAFAWVCIDAGGRLRLATDRYGLRPLFYRRRGGLLHFATHLRGLAALAPLPEVDEEALLHYYNFGVTPNDRTLLRDVRKLPPGTELVAEGGVPHESPYFSLARLYDPERYAGCSEDELCREIDARLDRAVERRLAGAGTVGVALSGGVDSGLLAAKAARGGARITGYTLAYGRSYDEFTRVDHLARLLGIEVRKITVTPGEVIANFEHASGVGSEPLGFNNATMRFVALAARSDGVRTLLDGDGADRLFLGMTRHQQYARLIRAYEWLARRGLVPLATGALALVPSRELRKVRLHFENWRRGIPPYGERGLGRVRGYDEAYERRVYELAVARHREQFRRVVGDGDFGLFFTWLAVQMCPEMFFHDPAEQQQELGLFPAPAFWDDEIVAMALSLGTGWKLREGRTKYILRRAAARTLDGKYWELRKIGLQDAYAFAVTSPEGRAWRARRLEQARASPEAEMLAAALPPDALEPERLLPLVVWKDRHGLG